MKTMIPQLGIGAFAASCTIAAQVALSQGLIAITTAELAAGRPGYFRDNGTPQSWQPCAPRLAKSSIHSGLPAASFRPLMARSPTNVRPGARSTSRHRIAAEPISIGTYAANSGKDPPLPFRGSSASRSFGPRRGVPDTHTPTAASLDRALSRTGTEAALCGASCSISQFRKRSLFFAFISAILFFRWSILLDPAAADACQRAA
jgi:hypothetical protein